MHEGLDKVERNLASKVLTALISFAERLTDFKTETGKRVDPQSTATEFLSG